MAPTAKDSKTGMECSVKPKRPSWKAVYDGYPKRYLDNGKEVENPVGFEFECDKSAEEVYRDIFYGKGYGNACATRVSIALLKAGMDIKLQEGKDVKPIQKNNLGLKDKKVIITAKYLKEYLYRRDVWCEADVEIKLSKIWNSSNTNTNIEYALSYLREEIKGRNGVYIILGGFGTTGHATLWKSYSSKNGSNPNNAIGKQHCLNEKGTVYFWSLI